MSRAGCIFDDTGGKEHEYPLILYMGKLVCKMCTKEQDDLWPKDHTKTCTLVRDNYIKLFGMTRNGYGGPCTCGASYDPIKWGTEEMRLAFNKSLSELMSRIPTN